MIKVFILYTNFFTPDGKEMSVGGIQTYIKMLTEVIYKNNMIPVIMQHSFIEFNKKYNDIDVIGVEIKETWSTNKRSKALFNKCIKEYYSEGDLIIVATHSMGVKNNLKKVIGIQHGITFDIRSYENTNKFRNIVSSIQRVLKGYNTVIKARRFNYLVAVDYNFLNWYRTMPGFKKNYVNVIPNCTTTREFKKVEQNNIKIIFARRFQQHRGTRLFSTVILDLLNKYENIQVTFAGNGPDEKYLKELFNNNQQVEFITYKSEESFNIHKGYDIAVIPTIGSEGTSLSLLEAMAAKCSVVATNVGGMTNIILDNYNGLLVNPVEKELHDGIESLIRDKTLRDNLANNAYRTVSQAFNYELWEKRWMKVLNYVDSLKLKNIITFFLV